MALLKVDGLRRGRRPVRPGVVWALACPDEPGCLAFRLSLHSLSEIPGALVLNPLEQEGEKMQCPECGLEYEEGVLHCEVCEVALRRGTPDLGAPGDARFVSLMEAEDADLFARVTSRLERSGIPWFVQSESSRGRAAAMVYVAESRAEEARVLVERAQPVALRER